MTIGLIGLDDIGVSLAQNLKEHKITVIGYDFEHDNRKRSADLGIVTTSSIQAVVLHLPSPRIIWNLIDQNKGNSNLDKIINRLSPNDIVIDSSGIKKEDIALYFEKTEKSNIGLLTCKPVQPEPNAIAWITGNVHAFKICNPIFQDLFGEHGYQYMGKFTMH